MSVNSRDQNLSFMASCCMLQVKVNLVSSEAERICIDRMVKGQEDPFTTPEGLAEVDSRMANLVSLALALP